MTHTLPLPDYTFSRCREITAIFWGEKKLLATQLITASLSDSESDFRETGSRLSVKVQEHMLLIKNTCFKSVVT